MRATLPRGEGYELPALGVHIERADVTTRILAVESAALAALPPHSLEETARLTALLKSCGVARGVSQGRRARHCEPPAVLEYLLLDRACPRTVLFCLDACRRSLETISGTSDRPERAVGRLTSELSFLEVSELQGGRLEPLLERLLRGIAAAGGDVAETFFTTRVLVPGAYAQAEAQQQ